jgi:hypothetical protein
MPSTQIKKIAIALLFPFNLVTTLALADEEGAIHIVGTTKSYTQAALSISDDFCFGESSVEIPSDEGVFISGLKNCKPKYGSEIKSYYEIGYRGKLRFVPQENIFLMPEERVKLENMTESDLLKLRNEVIEISTLLYKDELNKLLVKLEKTKSSGVAILKSSIYDESEYTEGTSVEVKYYNPTKKTIKYVTATIIGKNAVGDKVYSPFNNKGPITLRGIGPIESEGIASYTKKYAWHTDTVESHKIT